MTDFIIILKSASTDIDQRESETGREKDTVLGNSFSLSLTKLIFVFDL